MRVKARVNFVFVLLTLVPLGLIAGGLFLLHGAQVQRTSRLMLEKAIATEEAGQIDEARRHYQNYLGLEPKNADALSRYAQLLARTAKTPRERDDAFFVLERALRANPKQADLRRTAIDVALSPELPAESRRYSDAKFHVLTLLQDSPEQAELRDLLGQCLEGLGDLRKGHRGTGDALNQDKGPEKVDRSDEELAALEAFSDPGAVEAYRRSIAADPTRAMTYAQLARVFETLDDRAAADKVMDAEVEVDGIVAKNPSSAHAYLYRSAYRRTRGLPGADADLEKALALAPDDPEVLFESITQAIAARRLDDAKRQTEHAKQLWPNDYRVSLALSQIESLSGQGDASISHLEKSLVDAANESPEMALKLRWQLADVLIDQGKLDQAAKTIEALRAAETSRGYLDYLEARLHIARREWAGALEKLKTARALLPTNNPLQYSLQMLQARCAIEVHDLDGQVAAFRAAVDLDPDKLPARLGLAASLAEAGDYDPAIEIYRALEGKVPGMKLAIAKLRVAQALAQEERQRQWKRVEEALADTEKQEPDSAELLGLKIRALQASGQNEKIQKLASDTLARPNSSPEAQALALAYLVGVDPRGALGKIQTLDASTKGHGAFRAALIRHWATVGGPEAIAALKKIQSELGEFPESAREPLAVAVCLAFVQLDQPAEARKIVEELAAKHPEDFRYLGLQYELALAANDPAAVASVLQKLRPRLKDPKGLDFRTLLRLFELAIEKSGDADLLTDIIAAIRGSEGEEGAHWRVAEARKILRFLPAEGSPSNAEVASGLEAARRRLEEASARRPRWAPVALLQGVVEERSGHPAAAIEAYERAKSFGARNADVYLRLFRVYASLGRLQQADSQLAEMQALGLKTDESSISRLVVEGQIRQGVDPATLVEKGRKVVGDEPKSATDLLWLGRLLATAGKTKEAEDTFRRAIDLDPTAPGPWIALTQLLVRDGQRDAATALLEKSASQVAPNHAPIVLAQGYALLGEGEKALAQFDRALESRPGDPELLRNASWFAMTAGRSDIAESYIRKLLNARDAGPTDVRWARLTLAPLLAASGDPERRAEARKLVNLGDDPRQAPASNGLAADEVRARAQVMSLQGNLAWQQQAIALLEKTVGQDVIAQPTDQLLLAQLYERAGQWEQARAVMLRALNGDANNVVFLDQYLRWLLTPGPGRPTRDPNAAPKWLDRLKRLEPNSLRTCELEARYLAAVNKTEKGVELLANYLTKHPAELPLVATAIEQVSTPAQAEPHYRRLVEQSPDDPRMVLILAGCLDRQGPSRQKDAEALYNRFLSMSREKNPEAMLVVAQYLGQHGKLDEALSLCEQSVAACRPNLVADVLLLSLSRGDATAKQLERATRVLEQAQSREPKDPTLHFQLGNLYIYSGTFDRAIEQFEKCKQLAPDRSGPYNNLAWLIALTDPTRLSEALEIAEDAIARFGPTPELRDTRAVVYLQHDDRASDAARDLEALIAASLTPRPIWMLHLAQAQQKSGQPERAKATLERAIKAGLTDAVLPALERDAYANLRRVLGTS